MAWLGLVLFEGYYTFILIAWIAVVFNSGESCRTTHIFFKCAIIMMKNRKSLAHSINFRMDDELYTHIINGSKAAGLTKGEYIRQQLAKGRVPVRQELISLL